MKLFKVPILRAFKNLALKFLTLIVYTPSHKIIIATKDIFESRIKFKEIYEYDMKSKQLFKNGEEVQMPKNEAKLFFLLVSNIEKVVSYEVIENYVWSEKSMSNEALRMTIKKIRAKTDADLIKNISGVGYRLSGLN